MPTFEFNFENAIALAMALMQNKKIYELFPDTQFITKCSWLVGEYLEDPSQYYHIHKREFGTMLYFAAQSHWMGGN